MIRKNKGLGLAVIVLLIGAMGFSLGASPIITNIKAQLDPTMKYQINGESVMESEAGIVYNDRIYIPLRAVTEALGLKVDYEKGKVSMTDLDKHLLYQPIYLNFLEIVDINPKDNQVTVSKNKNKDDIMNHLVLNFSEDTIVKIFGKEDDFTVNNLKVGDIVNIIHSPAMTFSIPAQTAVYEIHKQDTNKFTKIVGRVLDVNDDEIFLTTNLDDVESSEVFIIAKINSNVGLLDIAAGDIISITTTGTMTTSLPGQVTVIDIELN